MRKPFLQNFAHYRARHVEILASDPRDPLDHMIAARAVERLARGGGHQFEPGETGNARCVFAQRQDQLADAAAGVRRIGLHGADARGLAGWIEQTIVA